MEAEKPARSELKGASDERAEQGERKGRSEPVHARTDRSKLMFLSRNGRGGNSGRRTEKSSVGRMGKGKRGTMIQENGAERAERGASISNYMHCYFAPYLDVDVTLLFELT